MKKLLMITIISIFLIFNLNVFAGIIYTIEWENTVVDVPVGAAITDYLGIPQAYLCQNGYRVDKYVGILWGEDDTDPDYIDTKTLGTYYLTYRAVSEIEETTTVSFVVYDGEAPTVNLLSTLRTNVCGSISYEYYFQIYDNYYSYDELTIIYDDSQVNYKKEGEYTLTVIVSDPSINTTTCEATVYVEGLSSNPIYSPQTTDFTIAYGNLFVPSSYFSATDATGKDISSYIEAELDTKSLGNHKVLFSVTDDYSNTTTWYQDIVVYDDIAPKISLTRDRIEIKVSDIDSLNKEYFLALIESTEDNSGIDSIEVEYASVKKSIGEYSVVYTILDLAGNTTTKTLIVSVVCESIPQIEVEDIYVSVGDNINYYNYFTVTDTYDGDITLNATIDSSNVDTSSEGIYFAYITAKNSYGKTNYASITVHVKKSFIEKYYWVFLIPVGLGAIIGYFIIRKRKSMV